MADIKISELSQASVVNPTDVFPATASGVTVKVPASLLKNYMGVGNLADLDTTDKTDLVSAVNEVNTKVSKTEDLIAYVQTSLVASKAYAVGEQFVYNGLLYKATAAISQGGTIVIDGNAELADSVTEQINSLKYHKVAQASANITWASQIQQIYDVFTTLSDEEKFMSFIIKGSNKFNIAYASNTAFRYESTQRINSSLYIETISATTAYKKYEETTISSTSAVTYSDNSDDVSSTAIELYTISNLVLN